MHVKKMGTPFIATDHISDTTNEHRQDGLGPNKYLSQS